MRSELNGSGNIIGYREMHQRLCDWHRLIISRKTVRQALKILDPAGVEARSRHCLRRRIYTCKEPNYTSGILMDMTNLNRMVFVYMGP